MSDIIERINRAIGEYRMQTVDAPKRIRLSFEDGRRLYAWAMENVVVHWTVETQSMILKDGHEDFLKHWTYNGLRIEPTTEPIGVQITD